MCAKARTYVKGMKDRCNLIRTSSYSKIYQITNRHQNHKEIWSRDYLCHFIHSCSFFLINIRNSEYSGFGFLKTTPFAFAFKRRKQSTFKCIKLILHVFLHYWKCARQVWRTAKSPVQLEDSAPGDRGGRKWNNENQMMWGLNPNKGLDSFSVW